jgi:hypothetical protein
LRVFAATPACSRMTFDTVMTETPNVFAMTFNVTVDMFDLR